MSYTVYRLLDHSGAVLYVGCTSDLPQRLKSHRATKPWWPSVAAHVAVSTHDGKHMALRAEQAEIEALTPPHNIAYTPRWTPGRQRRSNDPHLARINEARRILGKAPLRSTA